MVQLLAVRLAALFAGRGDGSLGELHHLDRKKLDRKKIGEDASTGFVLLDELIADD